MRNCNFFQEYSYSKFKFNDANRTLNKKLYLYFKRIMDIIFSLVGLIISAPIIFVVSVLIKIETPGPAFFVQERVGLNGEYFKLYKLRSMGVDAEKNGAQWAEKNDPRVTKVGAFIRKTRIDELPQFWNVLRGDMSLIGPRPERPVFTAKFDKEIPGFVDRLAIRPGLTGWAQVNGGYDITPEEKLKLDKYYIQHEGLLLDLKIIFKTIGIIFTGNGAR